MSNGNEMKPQPRKVTECDPRLWWDHEHCIFQSWSLLYAIDHKRLP